MAINLSDNIKVSAPKPTDGRYLNITSPYNNTSEVNSTIPIGERYIGLTVNILGDEYWYRLGITDSDLVLKQTGGGSGDKNNKYGKEIVTGDTYLTTGSSYVILVSGSTPVTIYLPTIPFDGMAVIVKDISGNALNNNITIDGNGLNLEINGSATINTNYGALEFMYDSIAQWVILSFVN